MGPFHQIKLEFVRPGPPHNQLLSPLTPYTALCGEGSPVTLYIPIEHHQLLSRLERLRYVTSDGRAGVAVPNRIREATMSEVGEGVAEILNNIRSLLAEEWRAVGQSVVERDGADKSLVHLRLVLTGSELSLIPFEMGFAPQGFPGERLEKLLQNHMPVVVTRESRRARASPVRWDRRIEPTILLVSAEPAGLEVPLAAHVHALRSALEPWIAWPKSGSENTETSEEDYSRRRLECVKRRLRVLPNASVESIYELCSTQQFTHIHILAHGDYVEVGGEKRFGLALCKSDGSGRKEVVSGQQLAKALQPESKDGSERFRPAMVTLSTCDSGNPGSILIPGGSIAHDLHVAGIPWVLASQFPLTISGSIRMTADLYPRLLRGDDPRRALHEARRKLFMSADRDHDWASLIAYATVDNDFDNQIMTLFERQMKRAIEVALNHADDASVGGEMDTALSCAQEKLDIWRGRLADGDDVQARARRAECYGIHGSTFKRIGILHYAKGNEEKGKHALERALNWYRTAIEQWAVDEDKYHWVATQALSLMAVLEQPAEPATFLMARQLAERDLTSRSDSLKAWAHGTMAELEMLAGYHAPETAADDVGRTVKEHCKAIVDIAGKDSFEARSTCRQFKRYRDLWKSKYWDPIAEEAFRALAPKEAGQSALPPYG